MSLPRYLFANSYYMFRFANFLFQPLLSGGSAQLRVLICHDVPPNHLERFESTLKRLAKSWEFICPEDFSAMIDGRVPIVGRKLLLTFDDGFSSNRIVAESVLDSMGIKALFFIVSDFVGLKDASEIKRFIAEKIHPGLLPDRIPDSWSNMGWKDLEFLIKKGHTIGAHTRNHARLTMIEDEAKLMEEIVGSGDRLSRELGTRIDHFAYTFGDIDSFNERALEISRKRYRYVYSGLRGNNLNVKPWAIYRDAMSPDDPPNLIGAFLEGGADLIYRGKMRKYLSWGGA